MFSGCMDSQTSADVHDVSKFGLPNADGAGGACTNALLLTLVRDFVYSNQGRSRLLGALSEKLLSLAACEYCTRALSQLAS